MLFQFLRRPYPIDKPARRMLLVGVLFGLFVFCFLRFFEPFGISELPEGKTQIAFGFGLWCAIAVLFMNIVVIRLFPKRFRESSWNVGKELLWVVSHCVVIGLGNACLAVFFGLSHWSPALFLNYGIYTVAVGIFPITLSVLTTELRLNSHYRGQSAELNTHLPSVQTVSAVQVTLPSDNRNEHLTIAAHELICLEAADNYVTVYHAEAGTVRKTILRSTLKAQEEKLSAMRSLFRAHKSYLVNCDCIERVSGNAQGYKLHLSGIEAPIPVSRKQNEALRRRLAEN